MRRHYDAFVCVTSLEELKVAVHHYNHVMPSEDTLARFRHVDQAVLP